MGKFCSQCGRPLQEGEICICQRTQDPDPVPSPLQQSAPAPEQAVPFEQAPVQNGPVETAAYQADQQSGGNAVQQNAAASQKANQFMVSFKNVLWDILKLFRDPVGTVKEVADENALMTPMIMVILNIAVVFLMSVILMIAVRVKLGDYAQWVSLPYVRIVFVLTILSAIYDFALAGALFLSSKVFFGEKTTFAKVLSVVGCKVLLDSVFILLGVCFMILSTTFGGIIIGLGMLFTSIVFIMGFQKVSELSDTRKFYAYLVAFVMHIIVMTIIYLIVASSILISLVTTVGRYL